MMTSNMVTHALLVLILFSQILQGRTLLTLIEVLREFSG